MTGRREEGPSQLRQMLEQGDRAALAQAITLVESTRSDHRAQAEQLLAAVMPRTGQSLRLAISGIPGSGKSTLIERLGTDLIKAGHRVAVLAIDPSSVRSGGSILGDKTRMANLAADPRAFIRPSPTSGTLGGVARRTREAMLLCEAAGYDIIIIETVGVGQSEVTAAGLVDLFVLVGLAGTGDELQGIKRGILELADIVVINKADGDNRTAVERAAAGLRSSLHILSSQGTMAPEVMAVSSLNGEGFAALEQALFARNNAMTDSGAREAKRNDQRMAWLREELESLAIELVQSHPLFAAAAAAARDAVASGRAAPSQAAREAVRSCLKP